jgi:serine protease
MAAPHVSGVVALMKAVNPDLSPENFDNLLSGGAITEDLGVAGRDDRFGYGLIDASKAVVAVQPGGLQSPLLSVSPSTLNFGSFLEEATLTVTNAGGGTLSVDPPTTDVPWLAVDPVQVDPLEGTGSYRAVVDRSALAPGAYNATISFTSSANTVNVPVIMQVVDISVSGDAGFHYVLVIDRSTGRSVEQQSVGVVDGAYDYGFTAIPTGTYEIVAGTDSNNDGIICDAGEACGAYLALDAPTPITLNADTSGLDFATGFVFPVSTQTTDGATSQHPVYKRIRPKQLVTD